MSSRDSFSINTHQFEQALRQMPNVIGKGAKRGLTDVKNDWVRESRDVAPLDTSNLRRQIHGKVDMSGPLDGYVEVEASASQDIGGKRFNYAYYIHEKDAGGGRLKQAGAVKKFIDKPAEDNDRMWLRWIEEEVKEELRKAGW